MPRKILYQISLWLPVVLWMFLIFHFSSGRVPVASIIYWQDFAVKKTGHFFLFGILVVFLYRALQGESVDRKKAIIWAIVIAIFYGATDEFHQMFTQGREARLRDVFIDGAGATAIGYLIYSVLPKMPKVVVKWANKFNLN